MALTATEPKNLSQIVAGLPPVRSIPCEQVRSAAALAPRLVVLDDDPTGTQTVADVPIVTRWEQADLLWALQQQTAGFYVLTNTRSLDAEHAAARVREVLASLSAAAQPTDVEVALVSRGDSTLRGHFPLETDTIREQCVEHFGHEIDAVLLIPAYVDAGRVTVDSKHWVRTAAGFIPAGASEFASDPTFGYHASDLRDFIQERTQDKWRRDAVARITLSDLRSGGVARVCAQLQSLRGGQPVAVDAACDEDLRVLALATMHAERAGKHLLYRTGPSFVRSRLGQALQPPLSDSSLAAALSSAPAPEPDPRATGGLVVVGSYVDLSTRQLAYLSELSGIKHVELDVAALLQSSNPEALIDIAAVTAAAALQGGDAVVHTTRELVTESNASSNLETHARVSDALVRIVSGIVRRTTPRWIVAKGGITSSDIATRSLGIRRAWVRGTVLDGIVSLWQPAAVADGTSATASAPPFIVFAGNVGDERALLDVVSRLRSVKA